MLRLACARLLSAHPSDHAFSAPRLERPVGDLYTRQCTDLKRTRQQVESDAKYVDARAMKLGAQRA